VFAVGALCKRAIAPIWGQLVSTAVELWNPGEQLAMVFSLSSILMEERVGERRGLLY
jgi:hypothetical protein